MSLCHCNYQAGVFFITFFARRLNISFEKHVLSVLFYSDTAIKFELGPRVPEALTELLSTWEKINLITFQKSPKTCS